MLIATSGEAALQRAAQAVPDIVLLDAMMPGMDGFEVARRLKALAQTAHIPIVFMTGLTAINSGVTDQDDHHTPGADVLPKRFANTSNAASLPTASSGRVEITDYEVDQRVNW